MGGRFKNQLVQPFNLAFIFFGVVTVTGFTALSIRCMLKKPERLFVALWHDCVEHGWPHIRKGMPLFLVFPVVLSTFTSAKNAISGYQWDASFIALDAALHGGDAWLLTQPVVASPVATLVMNFAYNLWVPLMWLVAVWQIFSLGPHRTQFLWAYIITWIVGGTLMAHIFASVGPCFVEAVHGNDRFAPLMAHLRVANETVPVWALTAQDYLLASYQKETLGIGAGISAMPSMHVAIATLMALLGWRISRIAGIAFTAFAVLIMIGSVVLGWHYAVDGYVGAALAWALWAAVGYYLRRAPPLRLKRSAVDCYD